MREWRKCRLELRWLFGAEFMTLRANLIAAEASTEKAASSAI